jgi:hypothetical protein
MMRFGRRSATLPLLLALPAAAAEWTEALPALAPALRACLAGERAGFALGAEPAGEGRVTIRLWRAAAAEDCLAEGGRVLRREEVPGAAPPEPAAPAFFLERRCVDARRVDAPDGRILGWLAYPACG